MGKAAHSRVGRLLRVGGLDKRHGELVMESKEQLGEIMQCSKEAIALAYMCRAYVTVPIGECPDPYCRVRECKTCGRVTPQAWEEVLNSEREERG